MYARLFMPSKLMLPNPQSTFIARHWNSGEKALTQQTFKPPARSKYTGALAKCFPGWGAIRKRLKPIARCVRRQRLSATQLRKHVLGTRWQTYTIFKVIAKRSLKAHQRPNNWRGQPVRG